MGAVSNAASRFDPTTTSGLAALSTGGLSLVAEDALQEGGFIEQNLLGGAQKDAAERAAQRQEAAALTAQELQQQTTEQIRGDLAPFREAGASTVPLLQGAIDDPSSRVLNNPFFQSMAADQEQRLLASAAARGKVGSGGTSDDLQRNLLLLGNQFAQQDITNLQNLTNTGANAAAQTGSFLQQGATSQGGILGNMANAQAASEIAQANAQSQATGNLLTLGATIFCDIRLKENVKFSHIEDGVRLYNWTWTDEALELVGDQDTVGPIAQELKKTHPEKVMMDEETGFYKVLM